MHASFILAGLAAASAYASPLIVRSLQAPAPSFAANTTSVTFPPIGTGKVASSTGSSVAGPLLGVPTGVPNPPTPSGFVGQLLTSDSNAAKFKLIQAGIADKTIDLKFDFNPVANPAVTPGAGGQVDLASRTNFPVLTDLGISAAGIFFQGCGLNTPHIHPRATELFTVVTNSEITTGFVMENGFNTELNTTLTQYQGTVFPVGSIHWQQNESCEPAVAIAGLNSDDPGASSIAQNFLKQTSSDIVDATLGFPKEINANNFQQFKSHIPAGLALGVESCLKRCNIPY